MLCPEEGGKGAASDCETGARELESCRVEQEKAGGNGEQEKAGGNGDMWGSTREERQDDGRGWEGRAETKSKDDAWHHALDDAR